MTVSPTARPHAFMIPNTDAGGNSRRRDCHFADISSPSLLKRLLKGEGRAAE